MEAIFLKLVNLSMVAGWMVLAVVLLRLIFRRAPRWTFCTLWGLVAIRLLCPFSLESALSLIPSAEPLPPEILYTASPYIRSGIQVIDQVVNPVLSASMTPAAGASANPTQILWFFLSRLWLLGVIALLLYALVSCALLVGRLSTATRLMDNIWESDRIQSPFVLGIVKPKIYLPYGVSPEDLSHVLAHERAHIQRKDHWWKPLGFVLLAVYWMNPLLWIAYALFCRDLEAACDEKVIRNMEREERRCYASALLNASVHPRRLAACPLAFGEVGVKKRVMAVMRYRKPALWIVAAALIACCAAGICLLTSPKSTPVIVADTDVTRWFDYTEDGERWDPNTVLTTEIPEFPGVTFTYTGQEIIASAPYGDGGNGEMGIVGMPIWNAYFCDLTGDGLPEICTSMSFGSGIIDNRVVIYDYANGVTYSLVDRWKHDYYLRFDTETQALYVDKKAYLEDEVLSTGRLAFVDNCLQLLPEESLNS